MTDRRDPRAASAGRRPTLADVARLAGVSQQTVSRVLNGGAEVHPGTRARIQQCIERVGYRPNRAARYLATNRSRVLGLVVRASTSRCRLRRPPARRRPPAGPPPRSPRPGRLGGPAQKENTLTRPAVSADTPARQIRGGRTEA